MENDKLSYVHKDYDFTVLSCLFAGIFGFHRILNGKKVSGGILFAISLFSVLLALVPIIGFLGIFMLLCTFCWSLFDLLLIITNKFKNSQNEVICYSGKFLNFESNKIVVFVFILKLVAVALFVASIIILI